MAWVRFLPIHCSWDPFSASILAAGSRSFGALQQRGMDALLDRGVTSPTSSGENICPLVICGMGLFLRGGKPLHIPAVV